MILGRKLIEIRGIGFINKGAELMLFAILEKLRIKFPSFEFAMSAATDTSRPYIKRAKYGLYQKANLMKYGIQFGKLVFILPRKIRHNLGLVLDNDIDIVLDASGFAYGDKSGTKSCTELESLCIKAKKNRTKVVLLPQAFGPFNDPDNKKSICTVLRNADLIFARDGVSHSYLSDLTEHKHKIKLRGDFTNTVNGVIPNDFNFEKNRFAIIPSYRMIDKTSNEISRKYLSFVSNLTEYLLQKGMKPFMLIHEGQNDLKLAKAIAKEFSSEIEIIAENNPLKIKGILGSVDAVYSCRFHGLVSALSQGTVAIGSGWSHKYKCLFNDYDFPDGLLDVTMEKGVLFQKMENIFNEENIFLIKSKILKNSLRLKSDTEKMWEDVFEVIQSCD